MWLEGSVSQAVIYFHKIYLIDQDKVEKMSEFRGRRCKVSSSVFEGVAEINIPGAGNHNF